MIAEKEPDKIAQFLKYFTTGDNRGKSFYRYYRHVAEKHGIFYQDSEEVVADFVLFMMKGQINYYDPSKGTWKKFLGACFMRHLLDWKRKQGRKKRGKVRLVGGASESGAIEDFFETVSDGTDFVEDLADKELSDKVDLAVCALPKDCRQIIYLRYFKGKSYREIGSELGISRSFATQKTKFAEEVLTKKLVTA